MISKLIEAGLRNRFIVLMIAAVLVIYGVYALKTTPVDAIPDLSENQVIIFTEWMGRIRNFLFKKTGAEVRIGERPRFRTYNK